MHAPVFWNDRDTFRGSASDPHPSDSVAQVAAEDVEVLEDHVALAVRVPSDLQTGCFDVVVQREKQLSQRCATARFDCSCSVRFGFDEVGGGTGLRYAREEATEEGAEGLAMTVTKLSNDGPDYSTALGAVCMEHGLWTWEVDLVRVGNTRVGLARGQLVLDESLDGSALLGGEAWFVDYTGCVKHNDGNGNVTLLMRLGEEAELHSGDTLGFLLDLRHNVQSKAPPRLDTVSSSPSREQLLELWAHFDADGSGQLSREELKGLVLEVVRAGVVHSRHVLDLVQAPDAHEFVMRIIMDSMDQNHDNSVDKIEFLWNARAMLEAVDAWINERIASGALADLAPTPHPQEAAADDRRGTLSLRLNDKSLGVIARGLEGPLVPVFSMDNIDEQLHLDFVIDGH